MNMNSFFSTFLKRLRGIKKPTFCRVNSKNPILVNKDPVDIGKYRTTLDFYSKIGRSFSQLGCSPDKKDFNPNFLPARVINSTENLVPVSIEEFKDLYTILYNRPMIAHVSYFLSKIMTLISISIEIRYWNMGLSILNPYSGFMMFISSITDFIFEVGGQLWPPYSSIFGDVTSMVNTGLLRYLRKYFHFLAISYGKALRSKVYDTQVVDRLLSIDPLILNTQVVQRPSKLVFDLMIFNRFTFIFEYLIWRLDDIYNCKYRYIYTEPLRCFVRKLYWSDLKEMHLFEKELPPFVYWPYGKLKSYILELERPIYPLELKKDIRTYVTRHAQEDLELLPLEVLKTEKYEVVISKLAHLVEQLHSPLKPIPGRDVLDTFEW